MIPKIIHYCWFSGDPYPDLIKRCIRSWKNMMPDYKLRLWNGNSFDFDSVPYIKESMAAKRWAVASDYIHEAMFLIGILFFITILPKATNRFGFHFLPDFWTSVWPVLCYFIGGYIRKFNPSANKLLLLFLIIITCTIEPLINVIFFPGHDYVFVFGTDLITYPIMISLFLLVHKISIKNILIRTSFQKISELSLYMYLFCALFDMLLYPKFLNYFISQQQFGIYFFILIPLLFALSFIASSIFDLFIKISRIEKLWSSKMNLLEQK